MGYWVLDRDVLIFSFGVLKFFMRELNNLNQSAINMSRIRDLLWGIAFSPQHHFLQIAAEKWRGFSQTGIKICGNLREKYNYVSTPDSHESCKKKLRCEPTARHPETEKFVGFWPKFAVKAGFQGVTCVVSLSIPAPSRQFSGNKCRPPRPIRRGARSGNRPPPFAALLGRERRTVRCGPGRSRTL